MDFSSMTPAQRQTLLDQQDENFAVAPESLGATYANAAKTYQIPPHILRAVTEQESGYKPYKTSPAGAQGLMQFMPATAQTVGLHDPFDPHQSIMAGAKYLRQLLDEHGSLEQALSAYNSGRPVPDNPETKNYVQSIAQRVANYPVATLTAPEIQALHDHTSATYTGEGRPAWLPRNFAGEHAREQAAMVAPEKAYQAAHPYLNAAGQFVDLVHPEMVGQVAGGIVGGALGAPVSVAAKSVAPTVAGAVAGAAGGGVLGSALQRLSDVYLRGKAAGSVGAEAEGLSDAAKRGMLTELLSAGLGGMAKATGQKLATRLANSALPEAPLTVQRLKEYHEPSLGREALDTGLFGTIGRNKETLQAAAESREKLAGEELNRILDPNKKINALSVLQKALQIPYEEIHSGGDSRKVSALFRKAEEWAKANIPLSARKAWARQAEERAAQGTPTPDGWWAEEVNGPAGAKWSSTFEDVPQQLTNGAPSLGSPLWRQLNAQKLAIDAAHSELSPEVVDSSLDIPHHLTLASEPARSGSAQVIDPIETMSRPSAGPSLESGSTAPYDFNTMNLPRTNLLKRRLAQTASTLENAQAKSGQSDIVGDANREFASHVSRGLREEINAAAPEARQANHLYDVNRRAINSVTRQAVDDQEPVKLGLKALWNGVSFPYRFTTGTAVAANALTSNPIALAIQNLGTRYTLNQLSKALLRGGKSKKSETPYTTEEREHLGLYP